MARLPWPEGAVPLDLTADYSRTTYEAELRAQHPTAVAGGGGPEGDEVGCVAALAPWVDPPGVCGQPCPTRRHRWHDHCVAAYNALASSAGFRVAVWNRDHGHCATCPPDAPPQPRHNGGTCTACQRHTPPGSGCWSCYPNQPTITPTGWDADHITPLADGGPNTLDNAQTLCLPCHRTKTAREATARALRRTRGT